jgi:uncharacterized phage protein (TIGR01671 family)
MQREIKFRAWDGIDYMSKPFTLQELQFGKIGFTKNVTIMQFTGLYDKNGKEIYEGDIVQTDDYSKGAFFGINQPVKNIVINYEELSTGIGFRILHKDSAKVIGNIYENPELLHNK